MSIYGDPIIESGMSDLDYYDMVNGPDPDDEPDQWCKGGSDQYCLNAKACQKVVESRCRHCADPVCEEHSFLCEDERCLNTGVRYCWRCCFPVEDYRLCRECVKQHDAQGSGQAGAKADAPRCAA